MNTVFSLLFIMILLSISRSDYVLYEVTAYNPNERALLYALQLKVPLITFLNGVSNEAAIPMDIIVKKEISHMFEVSLRALDIQWNRVSQVTLNDIEKLNTVSPNNISDSFYNWDDILNWIDTKKHKKYKKIVVAKTYEKRDIFFLKLEMNKNNPTVFIVGGEDGMDWISSAVILNLLNDLLEGINELKTLLNNFNFYLLPILNPDGFAYSKSQDRFWSKNRRKLDTQTKCNDKSVPVGINIAQNWFFPKTLKRLGEECNSVYIGHRPISQEENQSLSYVLNNLALHMIAFINVRGFGRLITVPYADLSKEIDNKNIVMEILKSMSSKVIKKHNISYYVGPTSSFLYNFTGNMADWVKKKLNTPLVYTVYLEDIYTVLPHPKNIKAISQQFYTIINESLLVTKDIYGPLFNNQIGALINFLLFNTIVIIQLLYFVIVN